MHIVIRSDENAQTLILIFHGGNQPLSTRLINPNFCFHLSHRRSTTVSLETRNSFTYNIVLDNMMVHAYDQTN